ncbi:glycosyltransferase family 4 protein [Oscillatoria sp. FACHB-1406]|uniref:glycosyltransferase family 4 protein n=1 Tax=Oscillatoria sp. FACHB-1406 TaxID=2692846 RepID=UPI00168541D7|nr:glycosyltransferase family 4 protein [Oscillatoria sp. FACHB-1406]MBD2577192.1 glycosyltransferase family 4 protein [Oscillatoria sp. FACHB-1406]
MKILFVITRADTVGGAQVHVKDLALRLKQDNHSIKVITGTSGKYIDLLNSLNIDAISCPSLKRSISPMNDFKAMKDIQKKIEEFIPDIISLHSSKVGILGRLACYFSNRKPCIFTAHGWSFTDGVPEPQKIAYRIVEKLIQPLGSKTICVSEYDRSLGISAGMNPIHLVTIHNGMPDIEPSLRANPAQSNPLRLIMVARMDAQKDHSTLLQAITGIPNIKLQFVGDGSNYTEIYNQAKYLELLDKVEFLGFQTNVAKFLSKAQIFLLISNWEGFPRTTLEAMRAGLPTIVSDVGGASEAIVEGQTGYCVPQGNVEILRTRILTLVNNENIRKQMGEAARRYYEQNFMFEEMYQKTLAVYKSVLDKNSKVCDN